MKKIILILGIIFLFFVSVLNPMVIGYDILTSDKELIVEDYNLNVYPVSEIFNMGKHIGFCKGNATPPDQPSEGPGSSNYSHGGVQESKYKWGAKQYWIFEPILPKPESAPLVVFNHGWGATDPIAYIEWIDHIVKKGNIVVYPRYQRGLYLGFKEFNANAIQAVKDAIETIQQGDHVLPELDKFAILGHSLGGGITANMAAQAEDEGLPIPKAIMPVQPFIAYSETANFSKIHAETLMIVVVGEDDTVVGNRSGIIIFNGSAQIPLSQKDFVIQVTDTYGDPDLVADHSAPVCFPRDTSDTVDAMDFYSTWKLFDALTDYAFYGINEEYCLGNTSEQRFMGLWSDGTPVNELKVTDNPVGESISVPVYDSKNSHPRSRIVTNLFYMRIFGSFPNLFPILQLLLQQLGL
jgi:predicted esterase